MVPKHQAAARRSQSKMSQKASDMTGMGVKYSHQNNSDRGHYQAGTPTAYGENFHDSGFLDADEPDTTGVCDNDFVLFPDGPAFIDEDDASMIAYNGSLYKGMTDDRAAYIQKYTSYNYDEGPQVTTYNQAFADAAERRADQAVATRTMLSQWASTPHRHESIAYSYRSDRLQQEATPPPSPQKRHRVSKSGTDRRRQ